MRSTARLRIRGLGTTCAKIPHCPRSGVFWVNARVLRLHRNGRECGRLVGHMHGAFAVMHEAMRAAHLDPGHDRLSWRVI